jgi:transcriptional regulator with XRE-family HTH domain
MFNNTSNIALMTNKEILQLIGSRIKNERISQNMQQVELANKCNLSIRAIQRLEQSGEIALEKLVKILRSLNRLDQIAQFMDLTDELENLSYEEFNKKKKNIKKRVFKSDNHDKELW